MREIFCHLQTKVTAKFGHQDTQKSKEVRYTVVAGFLFLRFFCPAILGPKLFSLARDHPPMKSARAFTLIAKTLQNLANLVEFGWKEEFMKDMNSFIIENLENMKHFLDKISVTIKLKLLFLQRQKPEVVSLPTPVEPPVIYEERELGTVYRLLVKNQDAVVKYLTEKNKVI